METDSRLRQIQLEPRATKPPCAISIDLDGEWIASRSMGAAPPSVDGYFQALPRFLVLLSRFDIRATFFVVGQDLLDPQKRDWIGRLHREGHEIANHSWSHPCCFSRLPIEEKRREIEKSHELLSSVLGAEPKGFRAPAYDIDEETMKALQEFGYRYDCSVLPSPAVIGRRLMAAWTYGWRAPGNGIGRLAHILAPRRPYHPSLANLSKRGTAAILEMPVSVTPFSRLPLSSTLHLTTSGALLPLTFHEIRLERQPIHWTFHLRDLVDPQTDNLTAEAARLPVTRIPFSRKSALMERIFKEIADSYDPASIRDCIEKIGSGERLQ